jgi:hypothetical protein
VVDVPVEGASALRLPPRSGTFLGMGIALFAALALVAPLKKD